MLSAWVRNGQLIDLFLCDSKNEIFVPETIFWGKVQKALAGSGGYFISLPENRIGFVRNSRPLREGDMTLVQVSSYPQPDKQIPLQSKITIKGRGIILTPGVPGVNISKAIGDPKRRKDIYSQVGAIVTKDILEKENIGLIVRTFYQKERDHQIKTEIENLLTTYRNTAHFGKPDKPTLVFRGPSIHERAERDWLPDDKFNIQDIGDEIDKYGLWDLIIDSVREKVQLENNASLYIEKTHAMIVIDVNSGGTKSKVPSKRVSLVAAKVIPRELRIRGFGGKVIIDFPSLNQSDKCEVEKSLAQEFKRDYVPTKLIGWTKSGNYELQRKRDRIPVNEILEL